MPAISEKQTDSSGAAAPAIADDAPALAGAAPGWRLTSAGELAARLLRAALRDPTLRERSLG